VAARAVDLCRQNEGLLADAAADHVDEHENGRECQGAQGGKSNAVFAAATCLALWKR
jgi:hypothetical protein